MSAFLPQPCPELIRDALVRHLARKLGWSGRTVDHLIKPLTNDEIARCLALGVEETRRALFDHIALTLGDVPSTRIAA